MQALCVLLACFCVLMYTSFLGLILDDLIALGKGKYKKC